jgi:hypothetical protein
MGKRMVNTMSIKHFESTPFFVNPFVTQHYAANGIADLLKQHSKKEKKDAHV